MLLGSEWRFLLNYTYIPDEALWVQCRSHKEIVTRSQEVWGGNDLLPIFKYFLPSHVEKGNCEILIDDEQDFATWFYGTGDHENPKPLSDRLFVFDRRRLPPVRRTDSLGGLYQYPTVGFQLMMDVKCSISLRHSDGQDIILFGREDVVGNGTGEWGRLVIKARQVWSVRRPVFRYLDDTGDGKKKTIDIFNVNDFYLWSTNRRHLNPELGVFEGASLDQIISEVPKRKAGHDSGEVALLRSEFDHHEVVLPPPPLSSQLERALEEVERIQVAQRDLAAAAAEGRSPFRMPRKTMSKAEALVRQGEFGAAFTVPGSAPISAQQAKDMGVRHRELLVEQLTPRKY